MLTFVILRTTFILVYCLAAAVRDNALVPAGESRRTNNAFLPLQIDETVKT